MPLTADQRRAFLDLMPSLGAGAPPSPVTAFLDAHREAVLDELGADPGFDQVRCGLLRALPSWIEGEVLDTARDRALQRLAAFVPAATSGDPTLMLHRHPAWVGLARLEAVDAPGADDLDDAILLASAGFEALTGAVQLPGDVLWALADAAEEVSWSDRAAHLLDQAADAAFADPDDRHRVRLVRGLAHLERGQPDAGALLAAVADADDAPTHTRVHALWVMAALARQDGDPPMRRRHLNRALALVEADLDGDGDEEVRQRLVDALADDQDPDSSSA